MKKKLITVLTALAVFMSLVFSACVIIVPDNVALTLNRTTDSVLIGGTTTITASVTGATNTAVTWTSINDTGEITISSNGNTVNITGVSAGIATVTAISVADPAKSVTATVDVLLGIIQRPPSGIEVTVSHSARSVAVANTTTLMAMVTNDDTDAGVVWSRINGTGTISITPSGNTVTITGLAVGQATVTATSVVDPTKSDTAIITIHSSGVGPPDPPTQVSVSISGMTTTVMETQTVTLNAFVTGPHGGNIGIIWSIASGAGNISIASDGTSVVITGVAAGSASITATSIVDPTRFATRDIIVIPLETFKITQSSLTLEVGSIGELTLERGANITGIPNWTSSNTAVVVIGQTGENTKSLFGLSEGQTTITVSIGGHSASVIVTVTPEPRFIVSPLNINLLVGGSGQIAVDTFLDPVLFRSLNSSIATVNSAGLVVGISAGFTEIEVLATTFMGATLAQRVAVTVVQPSLDIQQTELDLVVGEVFPLYFIFTGTTPVWSSSNSAAAAVLNGVITANGVGTATITGQVGNITRSVAVRVHNEITRIELDPQEITISEGQLILINSTVIRFSMNPPFIEPLTGIAGSLNWSSSDAEVATVNSSGFVTGVSGGTAIITAALASDSTFFATSVIIVI